MSNLALLFNLEHARIITFTGSGGKTTLMFQMARELAGQAQRVITTTTTKIHIPAAHQSPAWMTIEGRIDKLRVHLENLRGSGFHLTIGWRILDEERKLEGIPLPVIEEISRWNSCDLLLIEADGSRGLGLKGYADHEPVLPISRDMTIVLLALDEVGHPYRRQSVHRHSIVEEITGLKEGDVIEASHISALLLHERGYLKNAGWGVKILVLNKIMEESHHRAALKIATVQSHHRDLRLFLRGPLYGMVSGTELFETIAVENGKS